MAIEDLNTLPDPSIYTDPSYQTIFDEIVADFKLKAPEYANYQDSDFIMIAFSVVAGKLLEQQISHNSSVKQLLLKSATGDFLDNLGGNYGIFRLTDETDDAFRERISDKIDAFSNAATEAHYRFFTKESSTLVDSVTVTKPDKNDNLIEIAIKSTDNEGIADSTLIDTVTTYLNQDHIRAINDRLSIVGATGTVVNITAEITFLDDSSVSLEDLETVFTQAFDSVNALGRDVTLSWIISALNTSDVYKVTLTAPTEDVVLASNEFAVLGTITLTEAVNTNF